MITSYTVVGMTCSHCDRAVTDELLALPGVAAVDVDLATGRVAVESVAPLPTSAVRAAVAEAGYALVAP